jgi:4-hydroxy-tetrahydrodipicolinate synthase
MGNLINEQTRGVFVIAVTPFSATGEIDYPSVDSILDFYRAQGAHGLTILGIMGEAQKLSSEESLELTRHVLRRVGDSLPTIVGISGSSFQGMRSLAQTSMEAGAAGVMVAPAAGLRTDDQIFNYYGAVCNAIGNDIPVVYQDYPQSTGVYLSPSLFLRLVQALPQLVMLKHEDSPGLSKISTIRQESERQGIRRVSILVGNGALYYPLELQRGADGAMTGFAYPEMLVGVFERFFAGDVEGAEDLFDLYLPLVRYEQQANVGLAIRKEILHRRGAIASPVLRPPGYALTSDDKDELDRLMTRLARHVKEGTKPAALPAATS